MASSAAATYPVRLEVDDAALQSRLTVFFRVLMIIPHLFVFGLVSIALSFATFVAWIAIVFAGRYPDSLLRFSIGIHRWSARLNAYQYLLTGQFPPFGVEPEESYPVRLSVDEQSRDRNRRTIKCHHPGLASPARIHLCHQSSHTAPLRHYRPCQHVRLHW